MLSFAFRGALRLARTRLLRLLSLFLLLALCVPTVSADAVSENAPATPRVYALPSASSPASSPALSPTLSPDVPPALPAVSAKSAILCNAETGEVYFAHNADSPMPFASTTKIMTALVAIESAPLDTVIRVAPEAVGTEGSSVYLYENEALTLETLLYALLLESANDAAVAIACGIAGSVEAFVDRMNAKAQALGLSHTQFRNPHGLHDDAHYTTARELAVITAHALANETFRRVVSTYKKTVPQEDSGAVRLFINHNRLLRSYEGCIGVKTGYTKRSGRCLVTAAERDGLRLVAVTLSAPDDWSDHTAMLDYGFSRYETVTLTEPQALSFTLPVLNGVDAEVTAAPQISAPLCITLPKGHGEILTAVSLPRFLWGDYEKGETVGCVRFFCEEDLLAEVPIVLDAPVRQISYRFRPIKRIKAFFRIFD